MAASLKKILLIIFAAIVLVSVLSLISPAGSHEMHSYVFADTSSGEEDLEVDSNTDSQTLEGVTVARGCRFYGYPDGLIRYDDPEDMKYTWKKLSGSAEVSGGERAQSEAGDDFIFKAESTGEITIQYKAIQDGRVVRSRTKTYTIVDPYEFNRLINPNSTVYADVDMSKEYIEMGGHFEVGIETWRDHWAMSPSDELPLPTKDDYIWTQSGEGAVKEIPYAESYSSVELAYSFEGVTPGDVDLTVTSKDGKWSETISFRVHPDGSDLPEIYLYCKRKQDDYKGSSISFEFEDQMNHLKEIKVKSSDESIAVPGEIEVFKMDDMYSYSIPIRILGSGKVVISIVDKKYEEPIEQVKLTISEETALECWKNDLSAGAIQYGSTSLKVCGREGDAVDLSFAGKEWSETIPASGTVTFKGIPVVKTGTSGTITFTKNGNGDKVVRTVKVADTKAAIKMNKLKKSTKKVTITCRNVKAGDYIRVRAGKKTYTKKIKKDLYSFRYRIKGLKLKKGAKVKVTLYNRFKQVRRSKTAKVK